MRVNVEVNERSFSHARTVLPDREKGQNDERFYKWRSVVPTSNVMLPTEEVRA